MNADVCGGRKEICQVIEESAIKLVRKFNEMKDEMMNIILTIELSSETNWRDMEMTQAILSSLKGALNDE